MADTSLHELIARQLPGWSLEQPFYTSEEFYKIERDRWLVKRWYILGHSSELPERGSYIVRELLGESVLIARDESGTVRGFYNVCRHRGSRICEQDGRGGAFVCPYHAWSYRLDGSFRAAAALPDGIDTSKLGLNAIRVQEFGGIVWGSFQGDLQLLAAVREEFEPALLYYGIPQARIAARRSYPTHGNWKLVLENALECYHCFPAHPEYCQVMKWVESIARVPADGGAAWERTVDQWFKEEADPDSPVKPTGGLPAGLTYTSYRLPIGGGRKTQSQDGNPVAPLMGQQRRFDGGMAGLSLMPFASLTILNDHAVMLQILPTGAQSADVVRTWLVNGTAADSQVDVERMTWLWDVTTVQDKHIIERNAAGVRSRAYSPGPYSRLESLTAQFVAGYLGDLSASISPDP